MKGMNFIFYRKGFSLVEVVTAIAVLTLCIMALLSTYYSIYKLQNKAMYDTFLQRKAETIFFTKIYPTNLDIYLIKYLLNNDEDLNKYIEIYEIKAKLNSSYISEIPASKQEADGSTSRKNKKGYTITIGYEIKKTKAKKTTEIYIPVIVNQVLPPPSSSGGSNGTNTQCKNPKCKNPQCTCPQCRCPDGQCCPKNQSKTAGF
jgi:prepilin-type N-terminal cleavage/methylation domain-containing protein